MQSIQFETIAGHIMRMSNGCHFSDMVNIDDIDPNDTSGNVLTKEDLLSLCPEFCKINLQNIWYYGLKRLNQEYFPLFGGMLYFNKQTGAIAQIPYLFLNKDNRYVSKSIQYIFKMEESLKQGEDLIQHFLFGIPEGMQLEYLYYLSKIRKLNDLYKLFIQTYQSSDYGFSTLGSVERESFIQKIMEAKTPEQKKATTKALARFPDDILTVYRGEGTLSTEYTSAYSWTTDINTACFFAARFSPEGRLVKGHIHKKDVLEFISSRGENEIFAHPDSIYAIDIMEFHGQTSFKFMVDTLLGKLSNKTALLQLLNRSVKRLSNIKMQESKIHDKQHSMRVLLLCFLIGNEMNLSLSDLEILATASVFHDAGRNDDAPTSMHGKASRELYVNSCKKENPYVSFLCEYHCRNDEEGYIEAECNEKLKEEKAKRLLNIFKDADALDRVRFGIKGVDAKMLRTSIALKYLIIARAFFDNADRLNYLLGGQKR